MHRVGQDCRAATTRSAEESPLAWLAIMVAVTVLLSFAVAAAVNFGGLDRLLPNSEPFIPYYTT